MAIQISGTTVIDNSRNITNFESVAGNGIATQTEAEAGTNNDQVMTPLRVTQAIAAAGGGMVDDDINWSGCNVGCAVRGGGNVFRKTGGIIWIVAPSTAQGPHGSTWPMGYCHGSQGPAPNQAQRITGRSGWFVPDVGMLQCAYACRSYWDSYSVVNYWSSTEGDTANTACPVHFNTGGTCHASKTVTSNCVRPFRVICY